MKITVLLDDCDSDIGHETSSLLTSPIAHFVATKEDQVKAVLEAIQSQQRLGRHVVALFSYELGELLQRLKPKPSVIPFIEAFVFDKCRKLSSGGVSDWIQEEIDTLNVGDEPAGIFDIQSDVSQASYENSIGKIQNYISHGETYQVNYTIRLEGMFYGTPIKLYQALRQRQSVRFGAFIDADRRKIMCLSPELFLTSKKNRVTAQPMKGTLRISDGPATILFSSPKDRAENLMITDLIRNDLGQICKTGSIRVPELFQVQQVGKVHQMTSTVTGELKENISLDEILKATFPCGSITGAPKKRTMEIIQELEKNPRGLYCGSIGYFEPGGNFCLNVAIRTLELSEENRFEMGVGSGITIDSVAEREWQECQTKAEFIKEPDSTLGLIETMRCENGEISLLAAHLARLQKSANSFRINLNQELLKKKITRFLKQVVCITEPPPPGDNSHKNLCAIRLELKPDGEVVLSESPIEPIKNQEKAFWAADLLGVDVAVMSSKNALLLHKTTNRKVYDQAWQTAKKRGGFDGIFTNERGEITEGGRSNIFALVGDTWLTPPLSSGVLPGIMRGKLLRDEEWRAQESVLFPEDLLDAKKIVLVNALRGVIDVGQIFGLRRSGAD